MTAEPADTTRRIAVLGGGLAGLSAALRLVDLSRDIELPVDVTVYEASSRLGGVIETVHDRGYLIERGADAFLSKPPIVALCERLGLSHELLSTNARDRGALVLRNGRPLPVPAGFNLMAPAKLGPILRSSILSPGGKLRLAAERFLPARKATGDESLGEFARRRLGDEVFDRLVQPLVAGIYTADPDKLSIAATLPRFREMERTHGSLTKGIRAGDEGDADATGARYGKFASLQKGLGRLFAAFEQALAGEAAIRTDVRVSSIRRDRGRWYIDIGEAAPVGFDAVILAVPAFVAADLLSNTAGGLVSLLRLIPYASSAVVASGYRAKDVGHPLDAFGLVVPAIEKRDVLAVSFASKKFPNRAPQGRVLLRTFVGGATRPDVLRRSDADLGALVHRELGGLLGINGPPDVSIVTRFDDAMPQYHVGHLDLVSEIESAVRKLPWLELAGSAYRGVGIPDVVADGQRAADRIFDYVMTR